MNICVIGLGHVGLPLSLVMAKHGDKIYGVDSNEKTIFDLKAGKIAIPNNKIHSLLKKFLGINFIVSNNIPEEKIDVFIITIGTPIDNNTQPNLEQLKKSIKTISNCLKPNQLIILRSTIPIGTTRNMVIPLLEQNSGLKVGIDFHIVYAPQRTIEGNEISELGTIPQILGSFSQKGMELASKLFQKFTAMVIPVSSLETAEMIKLIDNTYRDVHFAFSNEIALMCERLNLDVRECISKANFNYPRNNIAKPSPGVGGPCLSKDPYLMVHGAKQFGYEPKLIMNSRNINEFVPENLAAKVINALESLGKNLSTCKIFVIGFAFKGNPETSDARNSSTTILIKEFKKYPVSILGYDPVLVDNDILKIGATPSCIEDGFRNADCIIIMNNHKSYLNLDMTKLIHTASKSCVFVDCWSMFEDIENEDGVIYTGIGFNSKGWTKLPINHPANKILGNN